MTTRQITPIIVIVLALATAVAAAAAAPADAAAGELGQQQRISRTGPDGNTNFRAGSAGIAHNPAAGEYLAVWQGEESRNHAEIFARLLGSGGRPLGGQFQISSTGDPSNGRADATDPAVVYNPVADEYLVAWAADPGVSPLAEDESEIYVQRISSSGDQLGSDDQRISSMGPNGNPGFGASGPTVAHNPARNEYVVAWAGSDDLALQEAGENEIFVQRLGATGTELGLDDRRVSAMGPAGDPDFDAFRPEVAHNPIDDEYLLVFQADDDGGALVENEVEVYSQRLSGTLSELGPTDQRISSAGPDGDDTFEAFLPSVAFDPGAREYLVSWTADDDSGALVEDHSEIYVQRIAASGAEAGTDDQRISSSGLDGDPAFRAFGSSVAYDSNAGELLVTWSGEDDEQPLVEGEGEVFAQRIAAGGAEVGADDARISEMGPDGDTGFQAAFPAVAFSPSANEYLIGWSADDDAPPQVDNEEEIFVRSLSGAGAPAPEPDPGPAPQPGPAPGPGPAPAPEPGPAPDAELLGAEVDVPRRLVVAGGELRLPVGFGCAERCGARTSAVLIDTPARKGAGRTKAKRRRLRFQPGSRSAEANRPTTLKLRLQGGKAKRRKSTARVRRSLRRGHAVRARVRIVLSDEAGNAASVKRAVQLRLERKR